MTNKELIERIRAEFVADELLASGYSDYSNDYTYGGPEGHAFTIEDIHLILDAFIIKLSIK